MIYIKNYQALNDFTNQNHKKNNSFKLELPSMIGKPITVFVDSGGVSGRGFTGILIEVLYDSIRLVTSLPSAPKNSHHKSNNKNNCDRFGTCTTIMFEHITAITYNYI